METEKSIFYLIKEYHSNFLNAYIVIIAEVMLDQHLDIVGLVTGSILLKKMC